MTCFMRQKDKSAMFLLLLLFLDPTLTKAAHVWSRTGCPEGKTESFNTSILQYFLKGQIFWQEDQTCHRPFYQGPCNKGHILIDHPQVPEKKLDKIQNRSIIYVYVSIYLFLHFTFISKLNISYFVFTKFKIIQNSHLIFYCI